MPRLPNKELEERLKAAGDSLSHPPSSPDELLHLLDGTEKYLSKIEQSPASSIVTALSQLTKALVSEKLLKHSDVDVKVGVAACISEITRITAPEAPYDDDKMKEVLQLIVWSFEDISDTSSRSFFKRVAILETAAKVRTCVIMLDLECDQMVIEMFQHFLEAIRDFHTAVVFQSMATIMALIFEESEDISLDILIPILSTLKKNNETVLPVAKKLAASVIRSSADKLKTYLPQALKALDASSEDYSDVVASLCQDSNENILKEQSVVKESTEDTATNGANETGTDETIVDANSSKKEDSDNVSNANLVSKTESGDLGTEEPAKLEAKVDQVDKENGDSAKSPDAVDSKKQPEQVNSGEDIPTSPNEVPLVEAATSLENVKDTDMQLSPSETHENEDINVSTPVQCGSLPERNQVKRSARTKRKGKSAKKVSGKKQPAKKANKKDGALIEEDEPKKDGHASDSETKSLDQTEKLKVSDEENIPIAKERSGKRQPAKKPEKDSTLIEGKSENDGGNASDSETEKLEVSDDENIPLAKKQKGSRKKQPAKKANKKYSALIEEDEPKKDGNASDSETKSLDQTEKLKVSDEENIPVAKKQRSGKRQPAKKPEKDSTLIEGKSENDGGNASDSETEKLEVSDDEDIPLAKKQKGSRKKQPAKKAKTDSTLIEEGESKNDGGNVSDSETKLDRTEKLNVSNDEKISVAKKRLGKKQPVKKGKKVVTLIEENESENNGGSDSEMHDDSPLMKVGRKGGAKSRSEKDGSKSSVREDGEDMVTPPRSPLKSAKEGSNKEETPRMSSNRKRTPGTEKASGSIEYGENLVGSKIKVWWPKDKAFYEGVVRSFDSVKKKHAVLYADGDQENLNLKRERWEFIGGDPVSDAVEAVEHSSDDASPDMKKKKGTSSEASSKHAKMEISDKSKSKDVVKKSVGKSKYDEKIKPKTKDNSKSSGKSEDAAKSKDVAKTPSNSKQDSQKTAKSKGKTPQSAIVSSSKVKRKSMDLTKSPEMVTPKSRESDAKSVKKRRR